MAHAQCLAGISLQRCQVLRLQIHHLHRGRCGPLGLPTAGRAWCILPQQDR